MQLRYSSPAKRNRRDKRAQPVKLRLTTAGCSTPSTLLESADGIILGGQKYYGALPDKMKVVIADWSWKMKVEFTGKVGGAFSTGGAQVGSKEFGLQHR